MELIMDGPRHEAGDDRGRTASGEEPSGAPLYDFRLGRRKRWLVVALGVITIGIGIAGLMVMWEPGGLPRGQARSMGFVFMAGTLLLFLAFIFGSTRVLITSSEVILIQGGLLLLFGGRKRESCRWDEATEVVVTSEVVETPYRGLAGVMVRPQRATFTVFRLVRKDGSRLELSRQPDQADIEPVLDALRRESAARGIPWREEGAEE
jgi:hypothetical protein